MLFSRSPINYCPIRQAAPLPDNDVFSHMIRDGQVVTIASIQCRLGRSEWGSIDRLLVLGLPWIKSLQGSEMRAVSRCA
jgi:hypothetical protein